jgi:uncharacterized DUF497 family protein
MRRSCGAYAWRATFCIDFARDRSKSDANKRTRGFDFAFAARLFEGRTVLFADDRFDYGEVRMIAIGEIDGHLYKVVYTDRDEVRRIISAHRASRQEKRRWQSSE